MWTTIPQFSGTAPSANRFPRDSGFLPGRGGEVERISITIGPILATCAHCATYLSTVFRRLSFQLQFPGRTSPTTTSTL
eukprot:1181117-Prorocentrum_minimum.AAC.2